MATVINNPSTDTGSGGGTSFLLGVVILLLMGFLFFYYGLPALRGAANSAARPANNITVPDKIDVNINNPGNSQ